MRKLVLVGGGSCSGKSHFCRFLKERLPGAALLSADDYYFDRSGLTAEQLADYNFDLPGNVDFEALTCDVAALLAGKPAPRRCYDFSRHRGFVDGVRLPDFEILAVDGIFALYYEKLRGMAACRVFVDASDEARLARRLARDVADRGRTRQSIIRQYASQVRPMYEKYVAPTAGFADIVLDNDIRCDFASAVDRVAAVLSAR